MILVLFSYAFYVLLFGCCTFYLDEPTLFGLIMLVASFELLVVTDIAFGLDLILRLVFRGVELLVTVDLGVCGWFGVRCLGAVIVSEVLL